MQANLTANGTHGSTHSHTGGDLYLALHGSMGGGDFLLDLDEGNGSGYQLKFSTSINVSRVLTLPAGTVRIRLLKSVSPNVLVDVTS